MFCQRRDRSQQAHLLAAGSSKVTLFPDEAAVIPDTAAVLPAQGPGFLFRHRASITRS